MEQSTLYIIVIIILLLLLTLSILGAGSIMNLVNSIYYLIQIILVFIFEFIESLGKNTGELVNGTGEVVTDTSIFGIEIIDGIIHDIGNIFKGQATPVSSSSNHLDIIIQNKGSDEHSYVPEPANNSTENERWCFIGKNDDNSNTCGKLQPNQSCESKKIYNNLEECQRGK